MPVLEGGPGQCGEGRGGARVRGMMHAQIKGSTGKGATIMG